MSLRYEGCRSLPSCSPPPRPHGNTYHLPVTSPHARRCVRVGLFRAIIVVKIQVQAQTAVGFQAMTIAMITMADDGGPNYATRRKQNAYNKTENEETAERAHRKVTNQNQM